MGAPRSMEESKDGDRGDRVEKRRSMGEGYGGVWSMVSDL